eukprot:CAMPEP_0170989688 /NCGR_PEP_ID=MMETSP0736-20130129/8011_1 /TAXON_ID=186038 /ORGANISM="Fragilariopsis kerguelensis, Strain L26-C5" /LENGTH=185 /DNA_ID=CAMNT_0011414431 /DNA_START=148 /DNA_END=705 /DNA_ORIENTATION=-
MKLSPFYGSLFLATSLSSLVARVTADFELVGNGNCLNANANSSGESSGWEYAYYDVDLAGCKAKCMDQTRCVGIDMFLGDDRPCAVYLSTTKPLIPVDSSRGTPDNITCYSYTPDAPTMDGGCMVEKQKNSYKKCNKLNKNKCAAETLCVMNTVTDKCAHVCDDKEKSDCTKPTFKGKKICTFQK